MSIYHFLACNVEITTTEEDDGIKSYNELLEHGFTKEELEKQFGPLLDLPNLNKNDKFFYIQEESVEKNLLEVIKDFQNPLARYYSRKKFIYEVNKLLEAPDELIQHLNQNKDKFEEIELWHTALDRYELDDVEYQNIKLSNLSTRYLDDFVDQYDYLNPKVILIEK